MVALLPLKVPRPLKYALPVVVAPPEIVRPPVCAPLPIVVDAYEVRPPLNCVSVDVAFPATLNGYAKLDLLLNVVQSLDDRHPACEPFAVWHPKLPPLPSTVNDPVSGDDAVSVDVATPYTPAPPFETRRLLDDGCDVVARPVHVIVEFVPPTSAPSDAKPLNGPDNESDDVAAEYTAPVGDAACKPDVSVANVTVPLLETENKFESELFKTWNKFALCPCAPAMVSGIDVELVACTVTNEEPIGVVVPNSDGVVVPTTAPDKSEKTDDVSCWRGDNVSDELLSDDTSTCR